MSAGRRFRDLVASAGNGAVRRPIQLLGAVNAYSALLAEKAGANCLYLSGSGVATASYGIPDLGITNLRDVVDDVVRITSTTSLPLLVDIDTGFGSAHGIARCIQQLQKAGAAGVHIEDQEGAKRCGHRPGKQIVSKDEMVDRIRSCIDARTDPDFVIMARTDALANEGIEKAIERSRAYIAAGADMLFPEACTKLSEYKHFYDALKVQGQRDIPILANITEFGKTPLYSVRELGDVGVSIVLYPLSAFRAQAKAAFDTYTFILRDGHQKAAIPLMQTREDLYRMLDYHKYEQTLDRLFTSKL
jgi:methylisocitrate lyase